MKSTDAAQTANGVRARNKLSDDHWKWWRSSRQSPTRCQRWLNVAKQNGIYGKYWISWLKNLFYSRASGTIIDNFDLWWRDWRAYKLTYYMDDRIDRPNVVSVRFSSWYLFCSIAESNGTICRNSWPVDFCVGPTNVPHELNPQF